MCHTQSGSESDGSTSAVNAVVCHGDPGQDDEENEWKGEEQQDIEEEEQQDIEEEEKEAGVMQEQAEAAKQLQEEGKVSSNQYNRLLCCGNSYSLFVTRPNNKKRSKQG